ncbi:rhodanese-like domain-containing protein [Paenibacillus sp. GCM10023252]|uniref:rhodanese-like domain-containing protein n=1 Tax=Paenibacillus sp. GCM10023252 TaxID=3252649 RepID=UPI00360BA5C1
MSEWRNIEANELLAMLKDEQLKPAQIIDVRELFEWEYYHIEGSTHIPMNELPARLSELTDEQPLYIICAHGVRSAAVCRYLEEQGCSRLHNVAGGMAAAAFIQGFQYD